MRFSPAAAALTLVVTGAMAQDLKTEDQKTLYALGTAVAKDLKPFGLTPQEAELVLKGLGDALAGRTLAVDAEAYRPKVQAFAAARRKVAADQMAVAGKAYLAKAATEKGAVKLESGLVYIPLKEGTGPTPWATDTVKAHYRGTLVDGTEFDNSYKRGQPGQFVLSKVQIKGLAEGLQKMKVGGKAKLVCPPALGYGERGVGAVIPPNATLIFEVELLEIKK